MQGILWYFVLHYTTLYTRRWIRETLPSFASPFLLLAHSPQLLRRHHETDRQRMVARVFALRMEMSTACCGAIHPAVYRPPMKPIVPCRPKGWVRVASLPARTGSDWLTCAGKHGHGLCPLGVPLDDLHPAARSQVDLAVGCFGGAPGRLAIPSLRYVGRGGAVSDSMPTVSNHLGKELCSCSIAVDLHHLVVRAPLPGCMTSLSWLDLLLLPGIPGTPSSSFI